MKITYTAPNRAHHYPYAEALNRAGHLHAFISGFSRLSPRSPLPSVGDKLKRHDFFQNLFLGGIKFNFPQPAIKVLNRLSNKSLDAASYPWAKESDAFIYYRTQGLKSTQRLHKQKSSTLCVMEEVNSHVEYANDILFKEYKQLGLRDSYQKEIDYDLRLKTYEEADCILCPSEFVMRSFLSKGFTADRLIKVNFGFGFPPVSQENKDAEKAKDDTFRLLYVGQIHYRKGLRYAIEAFIQLKHPKKEFIIVGAKTPTTGLENTAIPDGVIFTGPLKGEELKNQFKNASIFILPSLEEGLALVQGEALAFGVPLLITTNSGGDDLITDGVEGFVVTPTDTKQLTERLQQMADDSALLKRMSENAVKAARSIGDWDKAAERLVNELSRVRPGIAKQAV